MAAIRSVNYYFYNQIMKDNKKSATKGIKNHESIKEI
jgi:hypothetical protein